MEKSKFGLRGRLKEESVPFLGLYHYYTFIDVESGRLTRHKVNEDERDQKTFLINWMEFRQRQLEFTMCGRYYQIGISYDNAEALVWF